MFSFLDNLEVLTTTFLAVVTGASVVTSSALSLPAPKASPNITLEAQEEVQTDLNIATRVGEYSYAGKTVKYILNIPKNGGDLLGQVEGVCEGPITGTYDGEEGGEIKGQTSAVCSIAFLKKELNVKFEGELYKSEGKAELNYSGEIPYTNDQGSLTLQFEPIN